MTPETNTPAIIPQHLETATATASAAASAKALVEARYMTAFARPRDLDLVRQKLLKDAARPGFAKAAIYNKPVGKGVSGPSIRFAEAAARAMGNIVADVSTSFEDDEKRILTVTVTDLEANLTYPASVVVSKTVERSKVSDGVPVLGQRQNSQGRTTYIVAATDDDLLNKQNAQVSKAIRTLIMRLVPGDLVDEALDVCRATSAKEDAQDPDAARKKLLDAFLSVGVNAAMLRAWLGHDVATCSPVEVQSLRAMFTGLRDGETTWSEVMESRRADPAAPKPAAPPTTKEGFLGSNGGVA